MSYKTLGELGISVSRTSNEQNDIFEITCTIPNNVCFARVKKFYGYGFHYEVGFCGGTRRSFPIVLNKDMDETFSVVEHKFVFINDKRCVRIIVTTRDVDVEASHEIGDAIENPEVEEKRKPVGRPRKRKFVESDSESEDDECDDCDEQNNAKPAITYDGDDVVFIDNKPTATKRQKVQSIIKCKTKSIFCKQPIIRKINDNSYVAECEFPCVASLQHVSLMITDDKMHLLDGKGSRQTQMFSFKLPNTVADRIISADYSFEDEVVDGINITSLKIYIECKKE